MFPDTYEAKSPPQWATLAPERSPEFKVHTSLGLAHSAIANKKPAQEVALYHLEVKDEGAVWEKTWEYVFPEVCSKCKGEFGGRWSSRYMIPFDWKGTIKDAPVVCKACYDRSYNAYCRERNRARDMQRLAELKAQYE